MGGIIGGGSSAPTYTVAPAPVDTSDAEAEARKAREEAIARNRRGRAGMVATSESGVLTPSSSGAKSLLGE